MALEHGISNEAKSKAKFTEEKGHLAGGAKIVHWWGNGGAGGGMSQLLYMLQNALKISQ